MDPSTDGNLSEKPTSSVKVDFRAIFNFVEGQFVIGCHSCEEYEEVDLNDLHGMSSTPVLFVTTHLTKCGEPINV